MDSIDLDLTDGSRIRVPSSVDRMTTFVILEQEDWFEDEIRFVRRWLAPGMQAVDIGANFGVYTLAMARRVGPSGRVWSFEPTRLPLGYLKQSIAANGFANVDLISVALSSHDGTAEMVVSDDPELSRLGSTTEGRTETVTVRRLETVAGARGIDDVDFLKLDAEGEEEPILDGAGSFFEDNSPLVMFEIQHDGALDTGLVRRFGQLGYEPYRLIPGLGLLAPLDPEECLDPFQLNLFCCKIDRARQLESSGFLVRHSAPRFDPDTDPRTAWRPYFERNVFARALLGHWIDGSSAGASPGRRRHESALAAWCRACDSDRTGPERLSGLRFCVDELERLVEESPTFGRLSSLARAGAALGLRQRCVAALHAMLDLFNRGRIEMNEPFLPANPRFDGIEPAGSLGDWLVVGLVERLESMATYSSYFSGGDNLELLEGMRGRAFHSAGLERRLQLKRLRAGLQAAPEPFPARIDPAGLNRRFWTGDPSVKAAE